MISFYPGPSRVHDNIPKYVADAHKTGMLSLNHRSEEFVAMASRTIALLKQKLNVPKNYTIMFTSSATECWEIIAQSLKGKSYHLYNGAFGQKWYEYTRKINAEALPMPFELNEKLDPKRIILDHQNGLICITQNETSNGTQVDNATIRAIKKNNPTYLVAVDATSSLAGIKLDIKSADIWYASVQKCFGLPAGLAVFICSSAAVAKALQVNERSHYNSMPFMLEMAAKSQTPYTPNVLGIYLLMRVMEKSDNIASVDERVVQRYHDWIEFLDKRKHIKHLVTNKKVHSFTVLPIQAPEETITAIKQKAKKNGILLGEGYGEYKPYTFRIANFPALTDREIKLLKSFLKEY